MLYSYSLCCGTIGGIIVIVSLLIFIVIICFYLNASANEQQIPKDVEVQEHETPLK